MTSAGASRADIASLLAICYMHIARQVGGFESRAFEAWAFIITVIRVEFKRWLTTLNSIDIYVAHM
jgi:hypothetical protein